LFSNRIPLIFPLTHAPIYSAWLSFITLTPLVGHGLLGILLIQGILDLLACNMLKPIPSWCLAGSLWKPDQ
jgi:hypothetical protein